MTRWGTAGTGILILSLVAGTALAAITWTSDSTLEVSAVSPPIQFAKGDNADNKRYFKSFTLSDNKTSFTAEVKPRGGADTTVKDVVRITGADSDHQITLTATQVTNSNVEDFEWRIKDGSTRVATLDYLTSEPSASFSLPANQTYTFELKMDLADGAGRDNAGITFDLQLEVGPS